MGSERLFALALLTMVAAALVACSLHASVSGSGRIIVYPDGSVALVASISGLHTSYPPIVLSIHLRASGRLILVSINGSSPRPLDPRIVRAYMVSWGAYKYGSNSSRYLSRVVLFEDLGRQGWIRIESNVSSIYNYTALKKIDRIVVKLSALGAMRSVVTASTLISREGIESQLRRSGVTWINVTEARARIVNGSALLSFVIVTDLRGLAKHVAETQGMSFSQALRSLAPPAVSLRYWISMNSSSGDTRIEAAINSSGDLHQATLALKDMVFLPSVGASGVAVGVSLTRGLYIAMDLADYVTRDLEATHLVLEPSSAWINVSVGGSGLANVSIATPRLKAASSDPMDALRALAIGLYAISRDSDLPQWVSKAASTLLEMRFELVPSSPQSRVPAKEVVLGDLLKSSRTLTVSITVPRTSTTTTVAPAKSTAPARSSTSTTTSVAATASYSPRTTSARASSASASILLWVSIGLIAVSAGAIATAIIAMRRRY